MLPAHGAQVLGSHQHDHPSPGRSTGPETEVLIVDFQAEPALGRQLVDHASEVDIFGVRHTERVRVSAMLGFSARAGKDGLIAALELHAAEASAQFLFHCEQDQRKPLGRELAARGFRRLEEPVGPEVNRI